MSKEKYCDAGKHPCEKLWRARTKIIPSACMIHKDLPYEGSKQKKSISASQWKKADDEIAELNRWFEVQISMVPEFCENCGQRLFYIHTPKEVICHIVFKSTIKSVATHPLNRWFGCLQCHNTFDAGDSESQSKMKVAEIVKQRFLKFKHLITNRELIMLPKYLYDLM